MWRISQVFFACQVNGWLCHLLFWNFKPNKRKASGFLYKLCKTSVKSKGWSYKSPVFNCFLFIEVSHQFTIHHVSNILIFLFFLSHLVEFIFVPQQAQLYRPEGREGEREQGSVPVHLLWQWRPLVQSLPEGAAKSQWVFHPSPLKETYEGEII